VLARGNGKTKPTGSGSVCVTRPHAGAATPAVLYRDTPDRLGRRHRCVPGDR
jgi:hypothetical protein